MGNFISCGFVIKNDVVKLSTQTFEFNQFIHPRTD